MTDALSCRSYGKMVEQVRQPCSSESMLTGASHGIWPKAFSKMPLILLLSQLLSQLLPQLLLQLLHQLLSSLSRSSKSSLVGSLSTQMLKRHLLPMARTMKQMAQTLWQMAQILTKAQLTFQPRADWRMAEVCMKLAQMHRQLTVHLPVCCQLLHHLPTHLPPLLLWKLS